MGLDTSHDCWHGAYSAFHTWRCAVARAAGFDLERMEGFHGVGRNGLLGHALDCMERGGISPNSFTAEAVREALQPEPLSWEGVIDPLRHLLSHSDCDGELAVEHLLPIAERLEQLMPLLPDGSASGHIGNWRDKTQTFIDGLRRAAAAGEPVEFH